jgi:hypothetical protein
MEGMYKIVRDGSDIPVYVEVKSINDGYYGIEDMVSGHKTVIPTHVAKTWLGGDKNVPQTIEKLEEHPLKKRTGKIVLFQIRIGKDVCR